MTPDAPMTQEEIMASLAEREAQLEEMRRRFKEMRVQADRDLAEIGMSRTGASERVRRSGVEEMLRRLWRLEPPMGRLLKMPGKARRKVRIRL